MRKINTDRFLPTEQANAQPVSPKPKKIPSRWRQIAVAAFSGSALLLSSCTECRQLFELDRRCQIPTEFSADPQSRERLVEMAERDWNNCDENVRTITLFNLSDIADDEKTEPLLRTRIIGIFMNALKGPFGSADTNFEEFTAQYALQKLVKFATGGNDQPLRWFVAGKLKSVTPYATEGGAIAARGLVAVAMDPGTELKLFEAMVHDLSGFLDYPGNISSIAADGLVALINDARTHPALRRLIRNSLEGRYMRPIDDLDPESAKALRTITLDADEGAELQLTREISGAFDALGKNLESDDEEIRSDALYAFSLALRAGVSEPVARKIVDILEQASVYCTYDVRSGVLDILGRIAIDDKTGMGLKKRIINILAVAFNDDAECVRSEASRVLHVIAISSAGEEPQLRVKIVGIFKNANDYHALAAIAANPFAGMPLKVRIVGILRAASSHRSKAIRLEAVRGLSHMLEMDNCHNAGPLEIDLGPDLREKIYATLNRISENKHEDEEVRSAAYVSSCPSQPLGFGWMYLPNYGPAYRPFGQYL